MAEYKPMELAVYGKGGIGKSTISANLSAALALLGHRVMQIGCDPKHDSTRLLMHGENIPTVLEYLKNTDSNDTRLEDVLREGCLGIGCIEAGGPRPGVGCAGRGIISSFEFLNKHHAKEAYDLVVYDVLGDVVCGGFAVPVRREYADAIFLVTSGEYMALYAANNILRGIRNYDGDTYKRVAGIIYNERKVTDEDGRVKRFAQAVGLPICAKVPRSNGFALAEERKLPLMELEGHQEEKEIFRHLASQVKESMALYYARPLSDERLEEVVLGTRPKEVSDSSLLPQDTDMMENMECARLEEQSEAEEGDAANRPPLYGCAFNGAATAAIHLTDALIIAHSPRACAFYTWQNISSPGRKNLFNRGILMPSAISPNFECTDMGQAEAVFGGMDRLRDCVKAAMERKPGAIVVISSCVSGIIGDDIRSIEELSTPELPVIAIHADGDVAGDYTEGIRMCMHTLAERLIDTAIQPSGRRVNLINEAGMSNNSALNYRIVRDLLDAMEIEVNCRYLGDATCQQMRNLLAAPLNILASDGSDGLELKRWLMETYGCQFMDETFPVGFEASKKWLLKLGDFFSCKSRAEEIIRVQEQLYNQEIERLRPVLGGKRILLTTINANLDWFLETADAIGMEFVWIGVLNYLHTELNVTSHPKICQVVEEEVSWTRIHDKIQALQPDIVLSNYTSTVESGDYLIDSMPMTPVAGFQSAIHIFQRWIRLFNARREGEWRDDQALFEKYFA